MTLPADYLTYAKRKHGQDQDRYAWRTAEDRPKISWPGDRAVACMIVVPIEFHRLDPTGKPFKAPGAMQTPYPDLRHYTTRDYGNRVGVFRILDELARARLKATFAVNAVMLERAPPLIDAIRTGGHEIAAHGWEADAIHWGGMARADEDALVAKTRAAFEAANLTPRTWMSPARSESFATPDIVRAAGFDVCLDWEVDATPVALRTDAGPLACPPLFNELDDRTLLIDRRQTEDEWRLQILEAAARLREERARFGGQVLSFTLTPYVSGQPFRIHALRALFAALAGDDQVWSATASDIVDASGVLAS